MKGYFAFPPPSSNVNIPTLPSKVDFTGACTAWGNDAAKPPQDGSGGNAEQATLEGETHRRREQECALRECSEVEWVRAGGVLRDTFGRRDKARTEQIRQELRMQDAERKKMTRWEAYEARWRAIQASSTEPVSPIPFTEFPWPLQEHVSSRDLSSLTHTAISEFLFESLSVRTNATTRRERIRSSLLRWHPDKISFVLNRVVPDDLGLIREGIHVVFGALKTLQDAERTAIL